jgi:hypothetical protein
MTPEQLEEGYWQAYREFYTWRNIGRGAAAHEDWTGRARHVAYAAGWKKFERLWDALIRARQVAHGLPILEHVLSGFGRIEGRRTPASPATDLLSPPSAPPGSVGVSLSPRPVDGPRSAVRA